MSLSFPVIETEYASFDMFDTLVTRASGSPHSVFRCVERRAAAEGLDVPGFSQRRISAEARAIARVGAAAMALDDIYSELFLDYPESTCSRLKELEVQAEVDLCVPIAPMVSCYNECLEKCRAVVIVSDMYLPKDIVEAILERCGIYGYKLLYVSNEYGETKASGMLFKTVLSDLGIEPSQVTHAGDNIRCDFETPRQLGMRTVLVRDGRMISPLGDVAVRVRMKTSQASQDGTGIERALRLAAGGDIASEIGYAVLGPVLVGLCQWIHERKNEDSLDELYFVARDGYIMRRCYQILYPDEETTYFLASRRSTTVPMLWKNHGIDGFARTVGLGREMTAAEILMRLGLPKDRARELECKYGLSDGTRLLVSELSTDERFAPLFKEAEPEVLENSKHEFAAMEGYLNERFGDCKVIGLVDLGWRGSIQHAIESALPEMGMNDKRVEGLYFGIDPRSCWLDCQKMQGFLFSKGQDEDLATDEKWFNALVEALFAAPHGSVLQYVFKKNDCIEAELMEREAGNDDSSPLFFIQDAALRFARDFIKRNWRTYDFIDRDSAVHSFYRLGLEPTREEARFLGDIVFAYQEVSPLAKPSHDGGWYLIHPHELAHEMSVCYWKPAFLRRLFAPPVPWWHLLVFAKRVLQGGGGIDG